MCSALEIYEHAVAALLVVLDTGQLILSVKIGITRDKVELLVGFS